MTAPHLGDVPSPLPHDLSFLAPPDELVDWRLALAYEAAATAGLLDQLPATLDELATSTGSTRTSVKAVLGLLAAWGIVTEREGRYAAGPAHLQYPDDAMLVRHGTTIRRWSAFLAPRLRDRRAIADGWLDHLPPQPDLLAINARRITRQVVDVCLGRFPACRRALDLGGGHGVHALELARRGVEVTLQDLPHVIAATELDGRLGEAGIELFAGDLRTTLAPGPFDLVLCSGVTNMFDRDTNVDLYRRLRSAVAPAGGVVIVSYMRGRDEVAASFGLQMLAWTDGGDAHPVSDYRRWLTETGFHDVQVDDLDDLPQTVVHATLVPG